MNKSIHYNISLNIKTLQTIFKYFSMDKSNTIIELLNCSDKVKENINEFKDNIITIKDKSIYLKNITFEKLYYFLNKNFVSNVIYYKTNNKKNIEELSHNFKSNIESNLCDVSVYTKLDKIYDISFNNGLFNEEEAKKILKPYKRVHIEYIVIIILIILGILIRIFK